MAAGGSLRKFYGALALVAVAGALVIMRGAGQRTPPLTTDTVAPLASGPRGVVMGPDSAKVEIMEFSDFECPWCGRFAVLSLPDVQQRLLPTGRVRWRFVNFPLQGHTKSPYAHLAAACANEQGKFWQMHDLIYQNQEEWSGSNDYQSLIDGYAERAGVDRARYGSCISERRAWGQVLADKALGDSAGVIQTPTFFVNGRELKDVPTVDQMIRIVDSIAPARSATSPAPRGAAKAAR
ncbi:MAG: DsbA family protein [Gemmatimonadales bacterium]